MERILIVDDEESSRLILGHVLDGLGFRVEEAESGGDVLDRLAAGIGYDIVISDIRMPGMGGIELVRRLAGADPTLVTVLLTGSADPSLMLEAMRAGAFDFLRKPWTPAELNEVLARARERRRILVEHVDYRRQLEAAVAARESEIQYMGRRFRTEQRRLFVASIQAHARSIEAKDIYTAGHCDRVERYAEILARQAGGFSEEWIFNLRVGAILHDIGKIGVPSALLCKPGALSPEEQREVQSHPAIGGRIVRSMEGFNLESSVRNHHEHWDGTGYPDRLRGERIPMEARLILAADTFDAMTSNRPYRRALPTDQAIDELRRFSGRQFDPEVVHLMVAAAAALEEARRDATRARNPCESLAEAV